MSARQGEEFRDDTSAARATRLSAEQLGALTALDPWRSSAAVLQTLGLLALGVGVALWAWPSPWVIAPCVLLICTRQQALFVLAHEAAHYRLYRTRWLNDAVGRLMGTLAGISMCTYRVTHRLHHNHLYGKQDPDIALNGGYPRGAAYLVRKLLIDLTGWTAPKTYAYFFGAPAINREVETALRPLNDTSASLRQAARRDRWGVAGFHVAAPIAAAWFGGWTGLAQYLVLWLLPLATLLQAVLRLRAVAEHGAPSGYDSPLHAARTNLPGPGPLGWLVHQALFPHHVNYHVEHHLYPAVPHYHLPALHALLREQGALAGAEVRRFPETLARVFAPRGSAA